MEYLEKIVEWIRNPGALVTVAGIWGMALVIFLETGAMVFFLPGDSLLVVAGLYAAKGDLNIWLLNAVLIPAAILGDAVNYAIGKYFGPRVFKSETSRFLNKKHLLKTQAFYERHGGKTIILARFAPIIRTFAPFVAGIGKMSYPRFFTYNVVGAVTWVGSFLWAGYIFGNIPAVKKNFHIVIVAIVVISFAPVAIEFIKARRENPKTAN